MASFHSGSARSKSSQSSASSKSSRTPPSSAGRSSSSSSGAVSKVKRPSDILNPKTVDPVSFQSLTYIAENVSMLYGETSDPLPK